MYQFYISFNKYKRGDTSTTVKERNAGYTAAARNIQKRGFLLQTGAITTTSIGEGYEERVGRHT